MTKELLEYYKEKMCTYCKNKDKCTASIVIEQDLSTKSVKCVDYVCKKHREKVMSPFYQLF